MLRIDCGGRGSSAPLHLSVLEVAKRLRQDQSSRFQAYFEGGLFPSWR
jgi:hypothetical protein